MHASTYRLNGRHTAISAIHIALPRRLFSGALIFCAAYFVTVSVNAQAVVPAPAASGPADVIQMNEKGPTVVTGTVTEVEGRHVIIDSAGTEMHINLEDVEMRGDADTIFKAGMDVTVEGKMTGSSFGIPVIKASTITAREMPGTLR